MYKLDNWVYAKLSEPFEEVKIREGGGGRLMAYIDARQIVERLTSIVGVENWSDTYEEIGVEDTIIKYVDASGSEVRRPYPFPGAAGGVVRTTESVRHGGIRCTLTVLGVTKSDVGSPSPADELKGSASDALKRAAVKFGIGLYLYSLTDLTDSNPDLPEWAGYLGDPHEAADAALTPLIEKFSKSEDATAREAISRVYTMGRYDSKSPLIAKRYVYEVLSALS